MKGPLAGVSKTVAVPAATGVTAIDDSTSVIATRYDDGVTYDGDTGVYTVQSSGIYILNVDAMSMSAFASNQSAAWDGEAIAILMANPSDAVEAQMAPLATMFIPASTDFDDFKKVGFSGSAVAGLEVGDTVKLYLKHDATSTYTFIVNFAFVKIADAPSVLV